MISGKVKEISAFPVNDYTDDGQLLGHIVMGAQMVGERAAKIDGFPHNLLAELQHCILAHHGKLEYGSPKVPALIEAVALNYADDTDAKMETFKGKFWKITVKTVAGWVTTDCLNLICGLPEWSK